MPGLLQLEQEDLRDLEHAADAFLKVDSFLDRLDPPGVPRAFAEWFARLAEDTVALTLGFAARLGLRWEQYQRAGWAGHAEEVHALRGSLLRSFEARLRYLAQALRIASMAAVLTGRPTPGSERLPGAVAELTALKEEVFGKWQTLEDLQQRLVDAHPFSAEQFDALAAGRRPPPEWFQQEERPF